MIMIDANQQIWECDYPTEPTSLVSSQYTYEVDFLLSLPYKEAQKKGKLSSLSINNR